MTDVMRRPVALAWTPPLAPPIVHATTPLVVGATIGTCALQPLACASPFRDARVRTVGAACVVSVQSAHAWRGRGAWPEAASRERFFAYMSHELRTPVNAVLGYSTLLLEGIAGNVPAAATEMIGRIASSAQQLRALVDDLLDLSRLNAGQVRLAPEDVTLPVLLHETLASLEPQARAKGLTLAIVDAGTAGAPPRVHTDPRRVRQILLNLVSNAVKFTERGGITITVEHRAPEAVVVHVADTGVGIAATELERIFDEFVQVGAAHGGTGLGLAISRRLARLLGGELAVHSEPARGSCFSLTLPSRPLRGLLPGVDS